MSTKLNIKKKRGDTRRHIFRVKDEDGVVVDVSAWTTFLLTVDPAEEPVDDINNLFQIVGVLATDGTDGRIAFSPPGTAAIGDYFYDAQALDNNAEKVTIANGSYKITQDITKD